MAELEAEIDRVRAIRSVVAGLQGASPVDEIPETLPVPVLAGAPFEDTVVEVSSAPSQAEERRGRVAGTPRGRRMTRRLTPVEPRALGGAIPGAPVVVSAEAVRRPVVVAAPAKAAVSSSDNDGGLQALMRAVAERTGSMPSLG